MRPEVNNYYTSYLGLVTEQQYRLLGHFFKHHGPERVISRFPFLMRSADATQLDLDELVSEIQKIGSERFISTPKTTGQLPPVVRGKWEKFQGTVAQIIAESGLDYTGEIKKFLFLSNQQVVETASLSDPSIQIPACGFDLSFRRRNALICPSGFRVDVSTKQARLDRVYQYQSRAEGNYQQRINSAKRAYANPRFRMILAETVSLLAGVDYEKVVLPGHEKLQVKLVILQGSSPVGFHKGSPAERGNILTLDIPNMRNLAYFVLDTMTGSQLEPRVVLMPLELDMESLPLLNI